MKNVLITGKNSYIGKSLESWLSQWPSDYKVDTVGTRDGEWKSIDFSLYDTVVNVAGIAHSTPKKNQKDLYYLINRDLAVEIAKKAKEAGVKQYIFMSSAIVYNDSCTENGKITNETVPHSKNFYGDSKIQAEKLLLELESNNFYVVILRPPMVFGPNSKGNFKKLVKLSKVSKIFPDVNNFRSTLFIYNLTEFIKLIIDKNSRGIFFPQNKEYTSTTNIVRIVSGTKKKKIFFTSRFNPLINKLFWFTPINKMFGNFYYDSNLELFDFSYCKFSLKEAIIDSIREDVYE